MAWMGKLIQIVAILAIGLIIMSSIILPILDFTARTALDPMKSLDCAQNYLNLWGTIDFMKPFLATAAFDDETNLLKDPCSSQDSRDICQTWFKGARSDFKNRLGTQFLDGLDNTMYYYENENKKFRWVECNSDGCTNLEDCIDRGRTAIDPADTTLSIAQKNDVILSCFQVAKYMMRRNIHLEEQARLSLRTLSDAWGEAPP